MLSASGVSARIGVRAIPVHPETRALAEAGAVPGGTKANLQFALDNGVRFAPELDEATRFTIADAQTNGGLLASLPAARAEAAVSALRAAGCEAAAVIGRVEAGSGLSVEAG
jgi:selenide,water dikinase